MAHGNGRAMTFGVIVGNRGFFPDHLAKSGRSEMLAALERAGYQAVALTPEESKYGAVESRAEASRCAELFRKHAAEIDGIIVTLPNFGDERAIADTLRMADLHVPVLVQATPDTPGRMTIARPARQLLRQDVGLQQSHAVPDSVLDHARCIRRLRIPRLSSGSRVVRGGLPRGSRVAPASHRRDRRPAGGIQYGALQREASREPRNFGGDDRSFGDSRPHRSHAG